MFLKQLFDAPANICKTISKLFFNQENIKVNFNLIQKKNLTNNYMIFLRGYQIKQFGQDIHNYAR